MNSKDRNRFYLLWTLAIVLCFCLAMFTLFFASCGKDSGDADEAQEPTASVYLTKDRF